MTAAALVALSTLLLSANGAGGSDPLAPPPGSAPPPEMAPPPAAAPPAEVPAAPGRAQPPPPRPEAGPAPMVPFAPSRRGGALRVAVIDPRPTGDIPARPLAAFTQSLVPEIRKIEGVSAIGMAEIRDMLGFERQRQMMGCSADESCLAEIAGSLGVDEIVSAELVLVRKSYTLSMRRLDMRKSKVLQDDSRQFDKRDGEELLSVVGPAIAALFPDRPLKEGKTRGLERSAIRRLNPPPLPRWVFVATSGVALAAAGGGGAFHLLAADAKDDFDRLIDRSRSEPVAAADLATVSDQVRARESTRNALLLAAGGLGLAAGVESFFTDWRNDRAAIVPLVLAGGAGVAVGGAF